MTDSDLVTIEDRGAHAVLRIRRPEKRNAMNAPARAALLAGLRNAGCAFKAVVLTGTGDSFCSGLDLKDIQGRAAAEVAFGEWMEALMEIRRQPAVFIAAVNGPAMGGGSTLINVCDLAIAAEEAEIGMPEIGFGIYPAMAGPAAQLRLAPKHAAWLVLTGNRIDGRTAERWGMVNLCTPRVRLEAEADALAARIAGFDAAALAESKRALDLAPARVRELDEAFDMGRAVNLEILARRARAG